MAKAVGAEVADEETALLVNKRWPLGDPAVAGSKALGCTPPSHCSYISFEALGPIASGILCLPVLLAH